MSDTSHRRGPFRGAGAVPERAAAVRRVGGCANLHPRPGASVLAGAASWEAVRDSDAGTR